MAASSAGTVTLVGGNNITLSTGASAITISGPNTAASHAVQTGISAISNSDTTYVSGTVGLSALANITIRSTTGNQFQFSVGAGGAETQTAISGLANSETTYTSGTVNLSGLGEVVVRSTTGNAFQISAPAHTVQTGISSIAASDTTYTSGSVQFTGSNMVTVKSSANQRVVIDATQSVQAESLSFGVSTGGNTVGDTGVNSGQRIVLSGQGQVSLSQATGANSTTVGISVPNSHAVQTGISAISNSETQYTSGTINLSGLGEVVVRSTTGNAFQISAPAHTVQTGVSGISNSETQYTSGTVNLSGLGAVVVRSTTGNAFQISVPSQTVQAESLSFGVSTGGNTVGDTGVNSGQRIVLSGQGQVSLSQATGANSTTVGISVPNSHAQQTGISAISNSDTTYTSGTIGLSALTNITIRSTSGNQFQFSVAAPGAGAAMSQYPDPIYDWGEISTSATHHSGVSGATGASTQWTYSGAIAPMPVPYQVEWNLGRVLLQMSAEVAGTGSATYGMGLGLYTLNANTALSLASSWQFVMEMSQNSATARTHRWYWGTNSLANSTNVQGNVSASFNGLRHLLFAESAHTMSASQYYVGWFLTQRTAGVNAYNISGLAIGNNGNNLSYSFLGTGGYDSRQFPNLAGLFSTTTNTNVLTGAKMPDTINTTALTNTGALTQFKPLALTVWRNSS